ncbi:hypothetical protein FH972_012404 [Carpinus fangiana]|uniref:BAHD acyltransferase n=1 Tax=Carpinus fangiana TaxID=176857 RepID=A0A5N6R6U3_9ROSI|nr:hypothetical protein FH972_012404 [Carpinus fangiana]
MKNEIVSRTFIKPSSPTPPHLKNFKLSLLDQLLPAIHGNMTFFFPSFDSPTDPDLEFSCKSQLLQKSISETLTSFYPLAGRFTGGSAIDCNDDGCLFIEARSESPLSDFLSKPDCETLDLFLPTNDQETMELSEGSMWLVKFSMFSCGGTAVSISLSHKIVDFAALITLLKSWTATCHGSSEPLAPQFTGASILPPREIPGMAASVHIAGENFIARRFVFSASKVAELKEKVQTVVGREQFYVSRVEVVLALLWKCAVAVVKSKTGSFKPTALFQAVNLRPRMDPPLPDTVFGNFVWPFAVIVEEEKDMEIYQLVQDMRKAKNDFLNNKANKFKGEGGFSALMEALKERGEIFKNRKELVVYKCSSWCKFPLYETDFGWGKPAWMTSANKLVSNTISLLDTSSGGVEALITLDEEEMAIFERHEELLEFASVNPSIVV